MGDAAMIDDGNVSRIAGGRMAAGTRLGEVLVSGTAAMALIAVGVAAAYLALAPRHGDAGSTLIAAETKRMLILMPYPRD
jgi:hypothetical protein